MNLQLKEEWYSHGVIFSLSHAEKIREALEIILSDSQGSRFYKPRRKTCHMYKELQKSRAFRIRVVDTSTSDGNLTRNSVLGKCLTDDRRLSNPDITLYDWAKICNCNCNVYMSLSLLVLYRSQFGRPVKNSQKLCSCAILRVLGIMLMIWKMVLTHF